jgi:type II secretion system protein N
LPLPKVDWTVWRPRLAYGAFALLSFALALRWTFPADAVKQRLVLEAAARGFQVDAERVGPGGLLGLTAHGLTLESGSGLKVPVDELTASLRLLPLLVGRRSLAFDATLYDGRIRGTADLSGEARRVTAVVAGVDLGRVLPLRKALGADVLGLLDGTADVTLPPAGGDAKPTGEIALTVKEAGIAGGQVPIPGMTGGLALPATKLGTLTALVKLDQGRATFEKLEAAGGEAELSAQGLYAVLQPRLAAAPLFGRAKVKAQDAFWTKPQTQSLKPLAEAALASSRGRDGAWHFQVAGSMGRPNLKPVAPAD